jgi:hypothetical protein
MRWPASPTMAIAAVATIIVGLLLPPAAVAQAPQPQTAPCVTATMKALEKRGYPYVWGAKGPNSFDCSGLTYWAYAQAGVDIGPSTYDQAYAGTAINCNISHLRGDSTTCWAVGDLIFLQYDGGQHVAIYAGRGLFMDCYSPSTGCVLHTVEHDRFYVHHFWQARRIVSGCEQTAIDPGTPVPTPPSGVDSPGIESIPDLVGYVSFTMPDPATWWPAEPAPDVGEGGVIGSVLYGFRWLGWMLSMTLRDILIFFAWLGQYAANFAATAINTVLIVINGIWRLGVVMWLGAKSMFLGLWAMGEDVRSWLYELSGWLDYPRAWIVAVVQLLAMAFDVLMSGLELIVSIGASVLGLLAWVAGLAISTIVSMLSIVNGETATTAAIPEQLLPEYQTQADSQVYGMVRGLLLGLRDSRAGWLIYLVWAMIYVWFFFWLARFFSSSREAQ